VLLMPLLGSYVFNTCLLLFLELVSLIKFLKPVFIIACIVWNAVATMIYSTVPIAKWR